ncbi:MAG: UDP-N-acetylglucosamine 2-epimerase (non-hydrolyzing) [Fimbriimonas ginsengisoli]|uniref:UDP-N-acetylglucosamine 2-epimerase (non-hydrolyzing) n=1 Tax=Fimbriimonas ginsengisoli TaxID=1005039 RepID=A0A931LS79_FIMGI|nr:UDP-N-acetylglucosamine 2-epimerase (non-hydrolyzing) [Fimbriimonas ginsengisoli]
MERRPRILVVAGTRPEAIKVAPLVLELRRYEAQVETLLVSTGQHREMLTQALSAFDLEPDLNLDIMQHGQTLAEVTSRALSGLDRLIAETKPDIVLAQGDTTTTFTAALAVFYRGIPFGHVEAGLRTPTIRNPFPEEFNRRAATLVTDLHFAPTQWAVDNLLAERVDPAAIFRTGNTGVDAVLSIAGKVSHDWFPEHKGRVVTLTTHRRENWGEPMRQIAIAARELLDEFPDLLLVVPMHLNPQVRATLSSVLGDHARARLIEPPEYGRFIPLMRRSALILSDSGGVQEEAPAFGLPVLVLRETTERPEGVEAGTAKLVGTDRALIFTEAKRLLEDERAYAAMAHAISPYGDGRASQRIRHIVLGRLGIETPAVAEVLA